MTSTRLVLSIAACFLILGTSVYGEVVQYESCSDEANSCTIHEVRISPCKEAQQNKACKIKKGKSAAVEIDFTPTFDAEKLTGTAFWTSKVADLPFVGMDTNACNYATCPIVKNQRTTYDFKLDISRKFPSSTYDVKWKLANDNHDQCCVILKIALVR
ncbi:MD-2-related lipid-recognition protein-like [Arctopsyche grandis]|uniref:MD-2-related lipid-recognition protein-like n=1 Tax=Arctopsyche grandis TaxID=121162 RepID=UPI00406D939F